MVNKLWVVTSYKTDFSWIAKYTLNYIIYDKSRELRETSWVKHQNNVGYNIYDICYFIINNYDNLPDVCVFIKANVFKHCNEEKFAKLIKNNTFTPLESYEHLPVSEAHIKGEDGGYMEINNSWYISSHINTYGKETNRFLITYDQFLFKVFSHPIYPKWIRFAPGGNYIVPRENILFYSKKFYEKLMSFVDYHQLPTEAHIIERALYSIFSNEFKEKNTYIAWIDDFTYSLQYKSKNLIKTYLPTCIIQKIRKFRNYIRK